MHGAGAARRPVTLRDADVRAATVVAGTWVRCWEEREKNTFTDVASVTRKAKTEVSITLALFAPLRES